MKELPNAMASELAGMSNIQKINCMYTGFNSKPIREWTDVYKCILTFIVTMIDAWIDRCQNLT